MCVCVCVCVYTGYLLVYFTALAFRYRAGRVTDAMLRIDKRPLWAIGACEAAAQLLFMCSAAHLPGGWPNTHTRTHTHTHTAANMASDLYDSV